MTKRNTGHKLNDLSVKLKEHWNASSKLRLFRQALGLGPFSWATQAAGSGRQLLPVGIIGGNSADADGK